MRHFFCFLSFCLVINLNGQVYRGSVKLLIDTAGLRVSQLPIIKTTVSILGNPKLTPKPAPKQLDSGKRAPTEKQKVQVNALLLGYSREADGDYHLILMDTKDSSTMIAELPNAGHPALVNRPDLAALYNKARMYIDSSFGAPSTQTKFFAQETILQITGILFFDKAGHGLGHAKNSAEIHPILEVKVLGKKDKT